MCTCEGCSTDYCGCMVKEYEAVKNLLQNNKSVKVEFIKLNGEKRTMICTLHPEILKEMVGESFTYKNRSNYETIAVWDLENEGWRSFRIDNITFLGVL